jgi:hypothetical protein
MATVLEECTTKEQRSVVHFLWAKKVNAKDIHKEMFPVYGWKCLSHGLINSLKDVQKLQMMHDQVTLLRF